MNRRLSLVVVVFLLSTGGVQAQYPTNTQPTIALQGYIYSDPAGQYLVAFLRSQGFAVMDTDQCQNADYTCRLIGVRYRQWRNQGINLHTRYGTVNTDQEHFAASVDFLIKDRRQVVIYQSVGSPPGSTAQARYTGSIHPGRGGIHLGGYEGQADNREEAVRKFFQTLPPINPPLRQAHVSLSLIYLGSGQIQVSGQPGGSIRVVIVEGPRSLIGYTHTAKLAANGQYKFHNSLQCPIMVDIYCDQEKMPQFPRIFLSQRK